MKPLVTVICLCYNHERFVEEALMSVFAQTYPNLEVIIVDDASTDSSRAIIRKTIPRNQRVILIENEKNLGNCTSFNKALKVATGKYVIDFATDDCMMPERIENQVQEFERLDAHYGVVFTNAELIDEQGKHLGYHYKETEIPPQGNVYKEVLARYFINPPTMMIRKEVLDELGGYDESLEYEDFDFWVRSSRKYKYCYLNQALIKRRICGNSHSAKFYKRGFDAMAESTLKVVRKAKWLNADAEEDEALACRIRYEFRQAFYMERYQLVNEYFSLLKELKRSTVFESILYALSKCKPPVFPIYKFYLRFFK